MTTPQRLAQYVQPNLPEARIAHQWAKISNANYRRGRYRTHLVPIFAVSLALCVLAIGGWKWLHAASATALNGTAVESGASGTQSVTLPDGSHVELGPSSRLVIDEYSGVRVLLTLEKGKAAFDVAHQTKRPFEIHAADIYVSVVGTRFSVTLGQPAATPTVTVQVEQGKVTVRNRQASPDDRILAAGQSWTSGADPRLAPTNSPDVAATPDDHASETPAPETVSTAEPSGTARPAAGSATAVKSSNESPKELFELAEMSRINGKLRDSADALNKLRRTYRSDPRAGLAAFELGRMRMDIFGDLSGSVDALRDAIQLSPGATFREDAESRLVQVYNRQGNFTACQAAKSEYLNHFPHGAANRVVSRLCEH